MLSIVGAHFRIRPCHAHEGGHLLGEDQLPLDADIFQRVEQHLEKNVHVQFATATSNSSVISSGLTVFDSIFDIPEKLYLVSRFAGN